MGVQKYVELEKQKYGMPFYFKDLRDNTITAFRAYIEGLNENVQPSWNATDYIGRSESAYTYSKTERNISMVLKLFATTELALNKIYEKVERLTSMCYPEYKDDLRMTTTNALGEVKTKSRMKPPLISMRLGELYGNQNSEVSGFFQSLTYDFPNEGTWETKRGKRVPKYAVCSFTFTVIHAEPGNYSFSAGGSKRQDTFYGISKTAVTEPI